MAQEKKPRIRFSNDQASTKGSALYEALRALGLVFTQPTVEAHRRLFGEGAMMETSHPQNFIGADIMSPDDVAMSMRPKSTNFGKDIALPKVKQRKPK